MLGKQRMQAQITLSVNWLLCLQLCAVAADARTRGGRGGGLGWGWEGGGVGVGVGGGGSLFFAKTAETPSGFLCLVSVL